MGADNGDSVGHHVVEQEQEEKPHKDKVNSKSNLHRIILSSFFLMVHYSNNTAEGKHIEDSHDK